VSPPCLPSFRPATLASGRSKGSSASAERPRGGMTADREREMGGCGGGGWVNQAWGREGGSVGQRTRSVDGHQPTERHSGAVTRRTLAPGDARWMRQASGRMKTGPTTKKTAPDLSQGPLFPFKCIDRERALLFSRGTARPHVMPVGRTPPLPPALELARTAVRRAFGLLFSLNNDKTHNERRGAFPDDCRSPFHCKHCGFPTKNPDLLRSIVDHLHESSIASYLYRFFHRYVAYLSVGGLMRIWCSIRALHPLLLL